MDCRGNSVGCFGIEIWMDTAKFTNVVVARFRKCRDLIIESAVFVKNKAMLRAKWDVLGEKLCILESYCLSSIRINTVLEELRIRRLTVIQGEICCKASDILE